MRLFHQSLQLLDLICVVGQLPEDLPDVLDLLVVLLPLYLIDLIQYFALVLAALVRGLRYIASSELLNRSLMRSSSNPNNAYLKSSRLFRRS